MSDISVIYQYIDDISPILGDFFRVFLQSTFVCKNRVRKAQDSEISMIYRDISVRDV